MKISTNQIGNYSPSFVNNRTAVNKNKVNTGQQETHSISKNEKQFFLNKYPENKGDIINYHFYKKGGQMSGVSVGTLIDKRG